MKMSIISLTCVCLMVSIYVSANNSFSNSVVIDSNNRVIIGGAVTTNNLNNFLLVRYLPRGVLDSSFNSGGVQPGVVITDIRGFGDEINEIVLDRDEKIVAAGFSRDSLTTSIALARYNTDGTLDTTFNVGAPFSPRAGIVRTDVSGFDDRAYAVAIDQNDKIVIAGSTNNGTFTSIVVARYNPDGTLDTTFNGAGQRPGRPGIVIETITGIDDEARGVVIDRQNRIVVAGFTVNDVSIDMVVVRYNEDGSLDTSFNGTGIRQIDRSVEDRAFAVKLDRNQKIVLAGISNNGINNDFAVVRLNTDGSFDTTFNITGEVSGVPGVVMRDIDDNQDSGRSLVIDEDNNIVITGFSQIGADKVFTTLRYLSSGILDSSFGVDGIVTTRVVGPDLSLGGENSFNEGYSVTLTRNGKIVITGLARDDIQGNVTTLRYNTDGSLDQEFNEFGLNPGVLITQVLGSGELGLPLGYTDDPLLAVAMSSVAPELLTELSSLEPRALLPTITAEGPLTFHTATPILQGTARPNALVSIYVGDSMLAQVTANEQGEWIAEVALPDGSYSIYIIAEDPVTRLTIASPAVPVIIDTTVPPVPVITTPSSNAWVDTTTPVIQGTAQPNSFVILYLNNRVVATVPVDDTGQWTYTSPVLIQGRYILSAVTRTRMGRRSPQSKLQQFTIDLDALRAPRITNPTDKLSTNNNKPIIMGESRAGATVTIILNGIPLATVKANEKGGWSYVPQRLLADGDYRLVATTESPVDKRVLSSSAITFTIDTVPPRPAVITTTSAITHTISGLAEPLSTISLYVDGIFRAQVTANATGRWGYTPTVGEVLPGRHRVSISVADGAGNVSSVVERTINF